MTSKKEHGLRSLDEELEDILDTPSRTSSQVVDDIVDEIRNAPILSVGLALSLGFLLGIAVASGLRHRRNR